MRHRTRRRSAISLLVLLSSLAAVAAFSGQTTPLPPRFLGCWNGEAKGRHVYTLELSQTRRWLHRTVNGQPQRRCELTPVRGKDGAIEFASEGCPIVTVTCEPTRPDPAGRQALSCGMERPGAQFVQVRLAQGLCR